MKLPLLLVVGLVAVYAEENALLKEFSDGNIKFSADVYSEMKKTNSGNFLVCPLSVDVILALVHAGAKGDTAKQLSKGLHLPESHEEVQNIFKELSPKLKGTEEYTLSSANKVYVKNGFQISDNFKTVAVNVFNSEIQNIDFTKSVAAATEMNKWVEAQTHDKIKDLISKDDLDEDTRAVLINAMYFKGSWVKQFSEYGTRKRPFHVSKVNKVDVDMMEITDYFNYYEDANLKAKFLEMPYEGNDISMTFILPDDVEGLGELENNIPAVLATPKYSKERVHVQIPKYKIESTIKFKPILENLGVKDLFNDNADLTGIGAHKEQLYVSKVIQKAFIEVEEKGTTAAAATAAIVSKKKANFQFRGVKVFEFQADHPFMFVLKHQSAGILFVGRLSTL
ncbi:hypothetical protein RN001_005207 [Aquatica leii]|uniref:Serpin domain-containing protein n=1 Tax=Aquatica leii TaxID=1421715 RepID=A0AAN7PCG9_9COLE|nr:hypothetical protein RN001_005207 [Aquatica leii]